VLREGSKGVPREFGETSKRSEKNRGIKKSSKSMNNNIFRNNTMIRTSAIKRLNTNILLGFFNDKIFSLKVDDIPSQF
jgi:hypothetical protein